MSAPLVIKLKQGDDLPVLTVVLRDGNKLPIDITGAAVKFLMKLENSTSLKIDSTGVTIDDSTGGQVTYPWSTGDLDTDGSYLAEFEITFGSGKILTCPSDEEIDVIIRRELG